jgi:hypothetical protein
MAVSQSTKALGKELQFGGDLIIAQRISQYFSAHISFVILFEAKRSRMPGQKFNIPLQLTNSFFFFI